MLTGLPRYGRDNNQLKNTPLVPGGQGEIFLRKCPPLNSECHAGAREFFATLSTCPKSLRPVREIKAGDSSWKERVGGSGKLDLDIIRKTTSAYPPGAFVLPFTRCDKQGRVRGPDLGFTYLYVTKWIDR